MERDCVALGQQRLQRDRGDSEGVAISSAGTFGSYARSRLPKPRSRSAICAANPAETDDPDGQSGAAASSDRGGPPGPSRRRGRAGRWPRSAGWRRAAARARGRRPRRCSRPERAHGDAARRVEVHVVHADAVVHDQPRPGHRGDHPRGDRGKLGQDVVGLRDRVEEVGLGPALAAVDRGGRGVGGSPPRCRADRT